MPTRKQPPTFDGQRLQHEKSPPPGRKLRNRQRLRRNRRKARANKCPPLKAAVQIHEAHEIQVKSAARACPLRALRARALRQCWSHADAVDQITVIAPSKKQQMRGQ
jgi:hypothetical protein